MPKEYNNAIEPIARTNYENEIKVLLTNARSLAPKFRSLLSNMEERDIDFSVITKSWLTDGQGLDNDVQDLELGSNVGLIYKNRKAKRAKNRKTACGGVVIVFDKSRAQLRERKVQGNNFELVCAEGRVNGIENRVVVFGTYIPPQTKVAEVSALCSVISDDIARAKAKYSDCLIFLMGDINKKKVEPAYEVYPDMCELRSGPTRKGEKLDLCIANVGERYVTEITPPLESETGTTSDHDCLVVSALVKRARDFEWIKTRTRKRTDRAVLGFVEKINATEWESMITGSTYQMVDAFHGYLDGMMDEFFPFRTRRRRSNEKPWITNGVRKRQKKSKVIFRQEGRSAVWREQRKQTEDLIQRHKEELIDQATSKAGPPGVRAYFNVVRNCKTKEPPARWDVASLFEGHNQEETANKVLEYFGKVTDGFDPLVPQELGEDTDFRNVPESEIRIRIRQAKKPKSGLPGDITPELITKCGDSLARPLAIIFNKVLKTADWPAQWKQEYITVIPKVNKPQDLSECRNIACTNFWSKLLERIALERLKSEIEPDPIQFGGIKGSGTPHFLAEVWDTILHELEEPGKAVNVCSIDFSKAFNRMQHGECLRQLTALGASQTSIRLVQSFLTSRVMRMKVGGAFSAGRPLRGGSPQGSIFGCYLYCATTQQLGPELGINGGRNLSLDSEPCLTSPPLSPEPTNPAGTPPRDFININGTHYNSTPSSRGQFYRFEPDEDLDECASPLFLRNFVPWNRIDDSDVQEASWVDDSIRSLDFEGRANTVKMIKYVDDSNFVEGVRVDSGAHHITTQKRQCIICPVGTRGLVKGIIVRAKEIGMLVNERKTQAICISDIRHTDVRSRMNIGEIVSSGENLKMLGFAFGKRPNADAHFAQISRAFRGSFWGLIHLRKSGFKGEALFHLYQVLVRPIIEYCAVIYHSLLTKEQSVGLEGMQRKCFVLAFGNADYNEAIDVGRVISLRERREEAIEKFVRKAIKNPKYAHWFPRRAATNMHLRSRRPIEEEDARTNRLYGNPINVFRRKANDMIVSGSMLLPDDV